MRLSSNRVIPARLAGCVLAALLVTFVAKAASRDNDEPIRVDARSVEANDKTGTVIYRGNVLVEQGRLSIRADRIEIKTHNKQTDLIRATGNPVKLRQRTDGVSQEIQAEANRVDYHVLARNAELTGNVTLRRGEDLFTADTLNYELDSKNLVASSDDKGTGRVHAVIQPKKPDEAPPRL